MGFFDLFKSRTTLLREEVEHGRLELEVRALQEAGTLIGNFVDPRERFFDPIERIFFLPIGAELRRDGAEPHAFTTEIEHAFIRSTSRRLAARNEFAINAIENRISYLVGTGLGYKAVARKGATPSEATLQKVQDRIDAFIEANVWGDVEQERVRRGDRDGESFMWLFPRSNRPTQIRFIEPDEIREPRGRSNGSGHDGHVNRFSFGIETARDDVQDVRAFWLDGARPIPAREIRHLKHNVDANVKRGLPLLFPVEKNLDRAEKLLRNMSVVMGIQSAIALIRTHDRKLKGPVDTFADEKADLKVRDDFLQKTHRLQMAGQPRIIDVPAGQKYEMPAAGVNAANGVKILQAELRAVASRLVFPEFMLTSDASNAAFASTLVAESPAHKNFMRWQATYNRANRAVVVRALQDDVRFGRLTEAELNQVDVQVEAPQIEIREMKPQTERRQILSANRIMSRTTWALQEGLDPDVERRNIDKEIEQAEASAPLPMPGDREEPDDEGGGSAHRDDDDKPPGRSPTREDRVDEQEPGDPTPERPPVPVPPAPSENALDADKTDGEDSRHGDDS